MLSMIKPGSWSGLQTTSRLLNLNFLLSSEWISLIGSLVQSAGGFGSMADNAAGEGRGAEGTRCSGGSRCGREVEAPV